ncbi:MAG: sulfatase-like hydrolase/transferase, partial [Syntrophomonadaceae bacterium]|nr:sulfatase-like hydrolase/transferase [Syntrophomonadaceae bacterium]
MLSVAIFVIQFCHLGYKYISFMSASTATENRWLSDYTYIGDWTPDYGSILHTYSSDKNYIVVLVDTFAKYLFDEVIEKNDAVYDIFDGFTHYPDAVSGYQYTATAVPFILTGVPYKNEQPRREYLYNVMLNSSISSKLIQHGIDAELYTWTTYLSPKTSTSIRHYSSLPVSYDKIYTTLLLTSFYKSSPQIIKRKLFDKVSYYSVNAESEIASASYESKYKAPDLVFLDNLMQTSSVENKKQLFKFIHLTGIHPPLFHYFNGTDFIETDERQSFSASAEACVELLTKVLNKYKELGIYDNSSIFIVADHGIGFHSTTNGEELIKNIPLVLHKPPHSRGKMTVSDRPYYTTDLKDTILYEAGISANKGLYSTLPAYDIRTYLFYRDKKDDWNTFYMPDMQEYIIKGNVSNPQNWFKTGKVYKAGYGFNYSLGKTIYILKPENNGLSTAPRITSPANNAYILEQEESGYDALGEYLFNSALASRYETALSGNSSFSLVF